ncbi:NAD(P)-dependent oxidoreductase [Actinoplanes sp. NBRC 103695]|uniref:NAD(P)-dependent oxidoreductase n=1 Tax=Actinoplanes sp. NBRC 103695 TaxID=3032202 RepID=UPI0024A42738|nr:NAD(P)-dependent oxidoreductase [Actinoplanes sp. NBRC 103695]GLY96611.1 3-hydroxyisobutyrate dehydrogenase [Actinoplanes sp. NBRC 103695]
MRVAVLGAGVMGAGMVHSLLRAGHEVTVWNRTPSKAALLEADGAVAANTVGEAVTGADAVLSVLFDAAATLAAKPAIVEALGPDAVWIQAATVGLAGIDEVADGVTAIVDAPVLGTKKPAEDGMLVILASGDPAMIERATPVFEAIGSRTLVAGTTVGTATRLKLVCNAWVALLMAGIGQSVQFSRALGIDPELFLAAIDGGPTGAPYAQLKGKAILAGDYTTSFAVDGVVKDVGLMVEAAAETGFPPELLDTVLRLYTRTAEAGHGDSDMAAVAEAFTGK